MESGASEHTYIQCIIDPPIPKLPTLAAIYCPCDGSFCSAGIVCALLQQILHTTMKENQRKVTSHRVSMKRTFSFKYHCVCGLPEYDSNMILSVSVWN